MVDFSKKNTKESGGKFGDRDWTVSNGAWVEETKGTRGFIGIFFHWDMEGPDGKVEPKDWLLGDAQKLLQQYGLKVNDDGQLEKIDDDKSDYTPRTNDETSQLFNSIEDAGVSAKLLSTIDENPGVLDGYTFHFVDKPTGKKQKKDGQETQYDQTWLVVESIVSEPGGKSGEKGTGKPTASAASATTARKGKPAPVVEPEEEEEEQEVDPVEEAAVATIQAVLAAPKKFIPTFNAKQNGGGVTTAQMRNAALGNAVPKEFREVGKAKVSKLMGAADVYEKYDGELWAFDADNGVVSAID